VKSTSAAFIYAGTTENSDDLAFPELVQSGHCGRNCGKSALDSILRANVAREKAERQEIVDASAAQRRHKAVLPQMRPVLGGKGCARARALKR